MNAVVSDSPLPRGEQASVRRAWWVRNAANPAKLADTLRRRGWRAWEHESGVVHTEEMPEVKLVSNLREFAPVTYEEA
jgi:hypothetical protein